MSQANFIMYIKEQKTINRHSEELEKGEKI